MRLVRCFIVWFQNGSSARCEILSVSAGGVVLEGRAESSWNHSAILDAEISWSE